MSSNLALCRLYSGSMKALTIKEAVGAIKEAVGTRA